MLPPRNEEIENRLTSISTVELSPPRPRDNWRRTKTPIARTNNTRATRTDDGPPSHVKPNSFRGRMLTNQP